jgi:hypothetical protein
VLVLACFASAVLGAGQPFDFAQGRPFDFAQGRPEDSPLTAIETMIPMRDGVKLYTQVYSPKQTSEPLPMILLRTPYGTGSLNPGRIATSLAHLVADGYVIVQQDIRGRFKSDGAFVMLRQPRDAKDTKAIDESTDTYDTIAWLLANVPNNNGRVGIAGTSYGAWLAVMGMLDPHPALKAVVPQASPADMWIGDDFHHNGAFRLSYGLEYAYRMESSKEVADPSAIIDRDDTYDWYLNLGPLANVNRQYFREKIPTWNDFATHPDYDAFWKRQAFAPWLTRVTAPTLNVAGWWDQEDFYGPLKIYDLLERHDSAHENFLVVGPWNHGGWSSGEGRKLGRVDFGSATAAYYRRENPRAVFRVLLERQRTAAGQRSVDVQDRRERMGASRCVAAHAQPRLPAAVLAQREQALVRSAARSTRDRTGVRQLRLGSGQSCAVSPTAHQARRRLDDMARRGPALRASPA